MINLSSITTLYKVIAFEQSSSKSSADSLDDTSEENEWLLFLESLINIDAPCEEEGSPTETDWESLSELIENHVGTIDLLGELLKALTDTSVFKEYGTEVVFIALDAMMREPHETVIEKMMEMKSFLNVVIELGVIGETERFELVTDISKARVSPYIEDMNAEEVSEFLKAVIDSGSLSETYRHPLYTEVISFLLFNFNEKTYAGSVSPYSAIAQIMREIMPSMTAEDTVEQAKEILN